MLLGHVVASLLFALGGSCGHDRGQLLLGRGDMAVAAVLCLVVMEC
jgi:hypothetical protein